MARSKTLDSCKEEKTVDSADTPELEGADQYTLNDVALKTAAAIQQWCETDDLDSGETSANRLMALIVGIADINKDGDITDDEADLLDMALNAAWDYLASKGADEEDIGALLNDWDDDAADRIRDLVTSALPDGDDAASDDLNSFVFGVSQEPALDAVYRNKVAIRGGKKVRIHKRISGTVHLSAKQKVAVRKMLMKSHSSTAQMHRMKSVRVRGQFGMKV
ncbi:hypothetical protein F6R98_10550 [Candidatus Methylospira mobilis]|uniref:Uncharacterized protein n=2 Tax=Candidatus Methylospira mobilis TaxID=1808979 RepID=A0A5Q0BPE0_9GAMM|nr:hypothetical protein F6R98_10550 [Candidatus Methylospira mobilis]